MLRPADRLAARLGASQRPLFAATSAATTLATTLATTRARGMALALALALATTASAANHRYVHASHYIS